MGLCFHLYFFFWTAAVPALMASFWRSLGLVDRAGSMVDPAADGAGPRREDRRSALPQVYANRRTFSDPAKIRPILERMGRGPGPRRHDPVRTRYLGNGLGLGQDRDRLGVAITWEAGASAFEGSAWSGGGAFFRLRDGELGAGDRPGIRELPLGLRSRPDGRRS